MNHGLHHVVPRTGTALKESQLAVLKIKKSGDHSFHISHRLLWDYQKYVSTKSSENTIQADQTDRKYHFKHTGSSST